MPALHSFSYAIFRLVPRVERGEFINVGVVLFCRTKRYLAARVEANYTHFSALAPDLEPAEINPHLEAIGLICAGGKGAGPVGQLNQAERFYWLVAPRSTIIQVSPVHAGLTSEPPQTLQHLFENLVKLA